MFHLSKNVRTGQVMNAGVWKWSNHPLVNTGNPHLVVCIFCFLVFQLKCHDCGIHHCSSCVTKEANSKEGRRCHKCRMLRSGNFTRRDLMHCKVRDLRSFLQRQNVPTNKCKEKEDLVDLVMLFCSSSQHFRDMEAHQQHVEELRVSLSECYVLYYVPSIIITYPRGQWA